MAAAAAGSGAQPLTLPAPLGRSGLAAYGALRAPLALLELPLFVLLPAYYAERLGLELVAIGSLLFAARAIDAIADPVIGASLDRNPDALRWRRIIWLALPVLVLAYACPLYTSDAADDLRRLDLSGFGFRSSHLKNRHDPPEQCWKPCHRYIYR